MRLAYYNDLDPFCCAVLEQQIAAGNLPEGDVDERDIRDVRADELMGYGAVHLFAGIGGFPLGFAWAGVPPEWRILTGGFPYTDISNAGKRAGIAGEQSGLWKEMYRLICECADCDRRFDFVVIENVAALASRGLDTVLIDLAKAGYDAQWTTLRASDFGAPHIRERLFLVAYPTRVGSHARRAASARQFWTPDSFSAGALADADRDRQRERAHQYECQPECGATSQSGDDGAQEPLADAQQRQCEGRAQLQAGWEQVSGEWNLRADTDRCSEYVADARSAGQPQQHASTLASEPCHTARRTRAPGSVEDVQQGRCPLTRWQVLNLARVWLSPAIQQGGPSYIPNAATYVIGQALRRVGYDYLLAHPPCFLDEPWEIVDCLSYCDLRYHRGTIYRAANFRFLRQNGHGIQTWLRPLRRLTQAQRREIESRAMHSYRSKRYRSMRAVAAIQQLSLEVDG